MVGSQAIKAISLFDYQACLAEIRQLLVDLGVSEYGGANCISRLGHIVGSLADGNKENLIDIPNTVIMTREWKRNLHKQISVFRQIMLDVDRSFPSHKMFIEGTGEGKEGRATLFRVVAVYAMYNPQVSYCQVIFTGMSYNAGMLLMNMSEEEVQGVSPLMYLTPWFMALFTSLPCWDAVLTIWDLLLSEGLSITFQVALALLDILSVEILPLTEIAQVLPILLRPPASLITREKLVAAIWKVKPILRWEIDSIQAILDEEKAGCKAPAEPSFFQRFIGLFSSNDESEAKFTTDIKMIKFSVVSGQNPSILTPSLCCSAVGALKAQHGRAGGLKKPVGHYKRHDRYNKVSRRRSNNGKDVLRRRHVVCYGSLGSPVRRSPCLAGQRTPVGTVVGKGLRYIPHVKPCVKKYSNTLKVISIILLTMIPWLKVSQASAQRAFTGISVGSLFAVVGWGLAVHLLFIIIVIFPCFLLKLEKPVLKSVVIMATKKSLAVVVTIAGFLPFTQAEQGLLSLPLILIHLGILVADSVWASWWISWDAKKEKEKADPGDVTTNLASDNELDDLSCKENPQLHVSSV
ncbi:TBC1 domain family member 10A [Stylophora pistillata]|uniref:TBC1 domain family member 10A n=1 Tax=Stylophora pistillata TaxID=50429 RepID=A0A2B4R9J6_STYPI|nr:TBC1 domain family member 10A [Stylophora pistillata]